eukprot:2855478-Heterocapsa_arctica.AAC.1
MELRVTDIPAAPLVSYVDRTNWPITWAEFFDTAKGLPPCLSSPPNCSAPNVSSLAMTEYSRVLSGRLQG